MKTFEKYKEIPDQLHNSILVIGNFDGVHRGHLALLDQARRVADEQGKKCAVLTFEPHPRRLFRPDDPPFRITPAALKAERLEAAGIETLFSIPFDWDFASQSAEDFVRDVLLEGIQPAHIVVGYDFRFGQLRKGDPETIKSMGIPITVVEEVGDEEGGAYSSSRIRQALRHGHLEEANEMLGWDWQVRGEVIKGDQRGRELGYPTANFALGDVVHPAYGVYAARVQVEGEEEWQNAAVNIGIRPMFEIPEAQVESYIFDFDQEIYGKVLKVKPVKLLRGEAKFENLDDLIAQMDKDCQQAREILES